jgi:16S rRNA (cytidine1402-2'-O)-methyltransferase
MTKAKLHLIPNVIADVDRSRVIPAYVNLVIYQIDHFIVENLRTARRFLRSIGYDKDFDNVKFYLLNKHTSETEIYDFIEPLKNGIDMGLLSEAGVPCIADPGAVIVEMAQKLNIDVIPYVGPSSIILALMASGFNGQNFAFHGYLPIEKSQRDSAIKKLEADALRNNQTQIFIEAPYRNAKLFEALLKNLNPNSKICIAALLTSENEFVKTKTVAEWKKSKPDINKKETIFLIYK